MRVRVWLTSRPPSVHWLALILCAGALGGLFRLIELPAAFFLGPMFAGIAFGVMGSTAQVPLRAYQFSIGLVGALVAQSITLGVLTSLFEDWPLMLGAAVLTVLLSLVAGLALIWLGRLPPSSALWGTAPGAAPVMMSMSESYGADPRLVVTMQYVRLICVIAISALLGHQLESASDAVAQVPSISPSVPTYLRDMALSLALVLAGVVLGLRVPAGLMLCPLMLGVFAQLSGAFQITLPGALMAMAYALIGGYVGLRFDRATLVYVVRKLPMMLAAALLLIALCAVSAWLFAALLERDYLSMFLATSPGGLDSLSIIAMESGSDVGLVVALQTLRLFAVVLFAPPLIKLSLRLFLRNTESSSDRSGKA